MKKRRKIEQPPPVAHVTDDTAPGMPQAEPLTSPPPQPADQVPTASEPAGTSSPLRWVLLGAAILTLGASLWYFLSPRVKSNVVAQVDETPPEDPRLTYAKDLPQKALQRGSLLLHQDE